MIETDREKNPTTEAGSTCLIDNDEMNTFRKLAREKNKSSDPDLGPIHACFYDF